MPARCLWSSVTPRTAVALLLPDQRVKHESEVQNPGPLGGASGVLAYHPMSLLLALWGNTHSYFLSPFETVVICCLQVKTSWTIQITIDILLIFFKLPSTEQAIFTRLGDFIFKQIFIGSITLFFLELIIT